MSSDAIMRQAHCVWGERDKEEEMEGFGGEKKKIASLSERKTEAG